MTTRVWELSDDALAVVRDALAVAEDVYRARGDDRATAVARLRAEADSLPEAGEPRVHNEITGTVGGSATIADTVNGDINFG